MHKLFYTEKEKLLPYLRSQLFKQIEIIEIIYLNLRRFKPCSRRVKDSRW